MSIQSSNVLFGILRRGVLMLNKTVTSAQIMHSRGTAQSSASLVLILVKIKHSAMTTTLMIIVKNIGSQRIVPLRAISVLPWRPPSRLPHQ